MPLVDIDRADKLDKIHTKRMLHAFSQICVRLIALEDEKVNNILGAYSICVMPGPSAAIEYPFSARQILQDELVQANAEKAALERVRTPKKKKK